MLAKLKRVVHLIRILIIIIYIAGVIPLNTLSIARSDNKEANYTTRYMKINNCLLTDIEFSTNLNNEFLFTQG